jgi:hypothetical protein
MISFADIVRTQSPIADINPSTQLQVLQNINCLSDCGKHFAMVVAKLRACDLPVADVTIREQGERDTLIIDI